MRLLSRLVWSEGMHLGPHQFQAQNRYFEDSITFVTQSLWANCYGLTGIKIDTEALKNGVFSVVFARGSFSDGLPFDISSCDPAPKELSMTEVFTASTDRLTICLAIPEQRQQGQNSTANADENVRFQVTEKLFRDETTGLDDRKVKVGRKQIRLVVAAESTPSEFNKGLVLLPIARVIRNGEGGFTCDPTFIAPCVQISSSERLMLLLRRLIEIMETKSRSLARSGASPTASGDLAARSIANFWLLHAVNSALPPLRHQWESKRGHPLELFLELSKLAGALCTFSLKSHPSNLPLYNHQRLSDCFEELDRHIREHLEIIVPTNCVNIPLKKMGDNFFEGDIADARCLGHSAWVLGVRAPLAEAELIVRSPQLVKVCSAKFVGELVRRALGGLELTHLPNPPGAINSRVEFQYFAISKAGPFWEHIKQTKQVGIYVPGDIPQPELDLQIVLES